MDDEVIDLTPLESEILLTLVDNINEAVTTEDLYRSIWSNGTLYTSSNTLRTHITHLRRKLHIDDSSTIRLEFVKEKGYRLTLK